MHVKFSRKFYIVGIEMLCERVMLHEDTSSWWRALVGRACQEATSRALQLCSPNHPPWATEHAGVATAGGEVVMRWTRPCVDRLQCATRSSSSGNSWFCQVVETEMLIRQAGASSRPSPPFRRPAPYL